jgi:hypothetical protein
MPRHAAVVTIVLLVSTVCRGESPRAPVSATSAAAQEARAPQDSGFVGTTAPLQRIRQGRPGVAPAVLRAVAAAPNPGYDRVVFEFAGNATPGYHVEYATKPVRRCGSGDPVSLDGAQQLVVRFEPAQAHDEQGNPLPPERERAPGLAAVKEMKLVCDFEGQVEWVLGVAAAAPYRVSELTGPARLALDVRHGK